MAFTHRVLNLSFLIEIVSLYYLLIKPSFLNAWQPHSRGFPRRSHAIDSAPVKAKISPHSHAASFVDDSEVIYVCRNSLLYGACASREYDDVRPGAHCPKDLCCSKSALYHNQGIGNWCSNSWAYCSSSIVYNSKYSYGSCNCKNYGSECPANSTCIENGEEKGGTYCACHSGYILQGNECIPELCLDKNKCGAGKCIADYNNRTETCECPSGYQNDGQTCALIDTCKNDTTLCGESQAVKSCEMSGPNQHVCHCNEGFHVDGSTGKCVMTELCGTENNICGDPKAVKSCEMKGPNEAKCTCNAGYHFDANTKKCTLIDHCKLQKNLCGDSQGVETCEMVGANEHVCKCKSGYVLSADNKCVSKDICSTKSPCGTQGVKACHFDESLSNQYKCECEPGYVVEKKGTANERCVPDICVGNPCTEKGGVCIPISADTYSCDCHNGYDLRKNEAGLSTCLPNDPCKHLTCPDVAHCEAQGHTATCKCNIGYKQLKSDPLICVRQFWGKEEGKEEEDSSFGGVALAASVGVIVLVGVVAGGMYAYQSVSSRSSHPAEGEQEALTGDATLGSGYQGNGPMEHADKITTDSSHWA